jgi:hypothetical protein
MVKFVQHANKDTKLPTEHTHITDTEKDIAVKIACEGHVVFFDMTGWLI